MAAGDVGLVAALLTKVFGFAVDRDGFERMSREAQLRSIGEGMDRAIDQHDEDSANQLFVHYRKLRQSQGV